jgi:uncharacterized membrane protein YhhN
MKTKLLTLFYFLTGILFIYFDSKSLIYSGLITKSLIIPILAPILYINFRQFERRSNLLMLAALFFSWAGDIILEIPSINGNLFIPGLGCFLVAQVMYFTVFITTPGKNAILGNRFYLLIPVILSGAGLVYYLYDDLGSMRIPVILYAIVILSMLAGAVNRVEKVNRISYWLILSGAVLFVISDSSIAINKFSYPFTASGFLIMSTYILAQFLIVTGYLRQSGKSFL